MVKVKLYAFDLIIFTCSFFLAYAFAELIDNALAATALNSGPRKIELRLVKFHLFLFEFEKVNDLSMFLKTRSIFFSIKVDCIKL